MTPEEKLLWEIFAEAGDEDFETWKIGEDPDAEE